MFFLQGLQDCLKTLILLSSTINSDTIKSHSEIKANLRLLFQQICSDGSIPDIGITQLCFDSKRINSLIAKYRGDCSLTDLETKIDIDTPLSAMQEALARVEEGKAFLKKANPDLIEVFDLVIHTLFYARSTESGGGSVSSAPGVIWCALRRNWTSLDISEFLVHELTHNLVFVDELCYRHYISLSEISDVKNYAKSAILKRQRPLDKVFHSLVVSYEILAYRRELGITGESRVHPSSEEILAACQETIKSIKNVIDKNPLVTDRFYYILEKINLSLRDFKNPPILAKVDL